MVFLYIYNARARLTRPADVRALCCSVGFVVFGGYLGVLFPHGSLHTPAESLLPANIAQNEYVQALVHPSFAEVQQPYGSPKVFSPAQRAVPVHQQLGVNSRCWCRW